jgi:type I restriction enzyme, S subunit
MIPNGWRHVRIKEIGKVITGSTPPTKDVENYGNEFLFVSPADLGGHKFVRSSAKMVTKKGFDKGRKIPPRSTLFTCIGSTIGKIGMNEVELITNQQINSVIPNADIDPDFIYYSLEYVAQRIKKLAGHQAVPLINKSDFEEETIILPVSKNEQEKIAKILSLWDQAIEKLDQILSHKEKRIVALSKELLKSGRNKYLLEELCTPKQWKTISSKELVADGVPVFGANSWIGYYTEANHQEDCIAVTCRGATCGSVNYIKGPSYITGNSMALDSLKVEIVNLNFLYFYLRSVGMNGIISGSAQPQITGAAIGKVEILLPSLDDQVKISSILMVATNEVEGLKKLKEKISIQKQGMMQKLLTGKDLVKI